MKCLYCDYETSALSEQDANQELDRHLVNKHPASCVGENQVLEILELHVKYKEPIQSLVADFFEIRTQLSDEFRKHELKERFME